MSVELWPGSGGCLAYTECVGLCAGVEPALGL